MTVVEAANPRAPVLVVGVGNPLRRDDAAGRHVAQRLLYALEDNGRTQAGEDLHGCAVRDVEVVVAHQLAPELAATMSGRQMVVVVDASVEVTEVTVTDIGPGSLAGPLTHHVDLASLVAMAGLLGTRPLRVVTVALPAADLDLGEALSPGSRAAVEEAVAVVARLCRRRRPR